ncbi:OmpA family protein [Campylobacter sp. MIT 21-1685]|uniref:OmpA family protein n=1 Tax=unclassified Campylobacter TaxID=2593542 RepID=UPI00224B4DE4|nr:MULTISPECIES: OmpA family protein [unclassified Campylobacter]MCX2682346.1 OmpA family protein [Campylobacter sp. MIT 21-1684]MCX2750626.1 OmpA family protein [Campylobacter sp. MIT 21-1682]MCX2806826.1 OmpA family protein [Campylobacter sp. MIT 21-1685]
MKSQEENNFWIAYADLMAGLLFVFILLIGAVVVKYVLTQTDLREIKKKLTKQELRLEESKQELKDKEAVVFKLSSELSNAATVLNDIQSQKNMLETNLTNSYERNENLSLSLDAKDKQILILLGQLEKKDEELGILQEDLKQARQKIQKFTLIRENLSQRLQSKLDDNISINSETGAISLPTEVLFDKDSYVLKDETKSHLKKILNEYFSAIMNDQQILDNIENIIIEGHTDSDGSYMYNLDLSQKRAYEVMSFIYTFYKDPKLQKILMASGRSFSEPVFRNGVEDKGLSRRIEIKFSIRTDKAIKEVQNFLEFR